MGLRLLLVLGREEHGWEPMVRQDQCVPGWESWIRGSVGHQASRKEPWPRRRQSGVTLDKPWPSLGTYACLVTKGLGSHEFLALLGLGTPVTHYRHKLLSFTHNFRQAAQVPKPHQGLQDK